MWIRTAILFLNALLIGAALPAWGGSPALSVDKRAVITHAQRLEDGAEGPLIHLPYFDNAQRLHWSEERVSEAGGCAGGWFPEGGSWSPQCRRTTVMLNPRVDECRCTGKLEGGRVASGIAFIGVDDERAERWRRTRLSPRQRQAPRLVGAHPEGMVFSDREIWSPATGKTIRPRSPGAESFYATYRLPGTELFLEFDAEVTFFRGKGGLYLHGLESGKRELVLPVDDRLTGYFEIQDISSLPGGRWILLSEIFTTRGPGKARFQIFDLDEHRIVFEEAFAEDHYVSRAKITMGPEGNVAFSFLDATTGEYVVVHYLVRMNKG